MKYKFRCLDAKYDESNEMLVLLALCEDFGEQRILHFARSDFHWKEPGVAVPVEEMHHTASLFKDKQFYMDISDDPKRNKIEESPTADRDMKDYRDCVSSELEQISDTIADVDRRTVHRLADVVERDQKRKEEHPPSSQDILDEIAMRARLKDLTFFGD